MEHQNERPAGGQWAEQAKKGMQKQEKAAKQQHGQGDDRTPGKPIGQVAYAQGEEAGGDLRDTKLRRDK